MSDLTYVRATVAEVTTTAPAWMSSESADVWAVGVGKAVSSLTTHTGVSNSTEEMFSIASTASGRWALRDSSREHHSGHKPAQQKTPGKPKLARPFS